MTENNKFDVRVYITQRIPEIGIKMLKDKGYEVDVSQKDGILSKDEFLTAVKAKPYDAVLCLLTNQINSEVYDVVPTSKIFANYAVGYNNIDVATNGIVGKYFGSRKRGITVTNT